MPSHTAPSALIKLYYLGGAPWEWPTWQDITGIKHGLFPKDDNLLPKPWTREDANDIFSYFEAFNALDTEDKKLKFAVAKGGAAVPGRQKWARFVSSHWEKWGIHSTIVTCLQAHNIHPVPLLVQEGNLDAEWPSADTYLPIALDSIALALFGIEAFGTSQVAPTALRKPMTIIAQRSWARIRKHTRSEHTRIVALEKAALSAFKGKRNYDLGQTFCLWFTLAELNTKKPIRTKVVSAIRAVARWKDIAQIYGTNANTTLAAEMLETLNDIMRAIGAKIPTPVSRVPPSQRLSFSGFQIFLI